MEKKETKTYKVPFSRQDYGYILIEAKDEQEARDIVDTGDFYDEQMIVKGGETVVDGDIIQVTL